jgi:hypothetical protein
MQGSQDKLSDVLREKLLAYEADVPRESRDFIFARLNEPTRIGAPKKLLYAVALLFMSGAYFLYDAGDSKINSMVSPDNGSLAVESHGATPAQAGNGANKAAASSRSEMLATNGDFRAASTGEQNDGGAIPALKSNLPEASPRESSLSQARGEADDIPKEWNETQTVGTSVETDSSTRAIVPASTRKVRLNVSVMPLLSFVHVVPGADGTKLEGFSSPRSLSGDRLGVRVALSADYALKNDRFLFGGISYFNYHTAFSYSANEATGDIQKTNTIDQLVSGFGISAGGRYPLKMGTRRKQYLSGSVEAQFLTSAHYVLTSPTQIMAHVGYANEIQTSRGLIRWQPTVSYSITRFQYPGLSAHPYWVGLEVAYAWPVN